VITLAPASFESVAAPPDREPSEDLDALRHAIERLPARQRQVVLMHYLEETRVNDIAALLSVTPRTVEGRLYQARRTLRALLGNKPSASRIGRMLLCL
jgi:RNA polymerase sigma-70 factor (ECF subfamily)